jgi:ubiquinone/menaquinone biosynthesis C-methylase UbiE
MSPTPKSLDKYLRANQMLWDEFVEINSRSAMYHLKEFKAGKNKLNSLERTEVGEVKGKSLLHLQCHFGMDTLSWARLGAQVTGMDFSTKGIKMAESLSQELNIPARFICCNLYDLPGHLDEEFDIVFTSYGVLCWLPDIPLWAQVVARFIKPGGFFYIVESHPFINVFDDEKDAVGLKVRYPYFDSKPMEFIAEGSYADPVARIPPRKEYEWMHGMGEIVTSLCAAGLRIDFLHELPFSPFPQLPFMEQGQDGNYRLPDENSSLLPVTFSLKATKMV